MKPNNIEPADQNEIETAGMPSLGRPRRNGQMFNLLILSVIGIAGVAWAVVGTADHQGNADQSKAHQTEVANTLAPLTLVDKPAPVDTTSRLSLAPAAEKSPEVPANTGLQAPHVMTWEERKLGYVDDVPASNGTEPTQPAAGALAPRLDDDADRSPFDPSTPDRQPDRPARQRGGLEARLEASPIEIGRATRLPDLNFLLTGGTLLDCALDSDIDSTLPGKVKAHLSRDQYSANKHVLLMPRGTELLGEIATGILNGQERQFVVFQRATNEDGVAVNLKSPATDAMGASGITGWVDSQFGKRFGAAIGIALLEDATAIAVASRSSSSDRNTIVLGNTTQAASSMSQKALESSINIPPIFHARHGTRFQVMLARDLDFSDVYTLERTEK